MFKPKLPKYLKYSKIYQTDKFKLLEYTASKFYKEEPQNARQGTSRVNSKYGRFSNGERSFRKF